MLGCLLLFYIFYNKFTLYPKVKLLNLSSGLDERIMISNITNKYANYDVEINKIKTNYKKKILLDKLLNAEISILEKLKLLEDNSIKPPNITAGGLKDNLF
jgi:hypothetical protein